MIFHPARFSLRSCLILTALFLAAPSPAVRARTQAQDAPAKPHKKSTKARKATDTDTGPITKALGSQAAPVAMEVFSDYQCPSCGTLYEQTLKQLIGSYVAEGKVYLVHRDFPLPMHKYSHDAARWVNAAARIGKYQVVEEALYDNQTSWGADGNIQKYVAAALSPADFKRAERMVQACGPWSGQPSCGLDEAIQKDIDLGHQVPVQATPTYRFYYKGQVLPASNGVVSWPILKQFIDQLMGQ